MRGESVSGRVYAVNAGTCSSPAQAVQSAMASGISPLEKDFTKHRIDMV